ncbi:hypothetical protein E4U61_004008 [Claviceps capensis]|nr:hypothetical protein E4U61_004008 [Claviceps capensis]
MSELPRQIRHQASVGDAGKEANVKGKSLEEAAVADVDKFAETDSSPKNPEKAPELINRLEPRASGKQIPKAFLMVYPTESHIAYQRLQSFLRSRKLDRVIRGLPPQSLTEEECANLFPLKCTDEQWAELVAEFPMEDISEIILRQMGHAMTSSKARGTGP